MHRKKEFPSLLFISQWNISIFAQHASGLVSNYLKFRNFIRQIQNPDPRIVLFPLSSYMSGLREALQTFVNQEICSIIFGIIFYFQITFDYFFSCLATHKWLNPVDTGRKLNVHKTFRRRPGRPLNVLCTFNVRTVSTRMT